MESTLLPRLILKIIFAGCDIVSSLVCCGINPSCSKLQPDKLSDLSWAIMHEVGRLIYRVAEDDVVRARNQVHQYRLFWVVFYSFAFLELIFVSALIGVCSFSVLWEDGYACKYEVSVASAFA